jgi:hypothetical protein
MMQRMQQQHVVAAGCYQARMMQRMQQQHVVVAAR